MGKEWVGYGVGKGSDGIGMMGMVSRVRASIIGKVMGREGK